MKEIYIDNKDLQIMEDVIVERDEVVPDSNQLKYQKDELAAFVHFSPNTFNEVEWGDSYFDKKPNEIFKLENDFQAENLVRTITDAGFKKIIITAKHHDGFVIWQSKFTEYGIKNTDYKNGKGDILEEISKYASIYDVDMGIYLSPWDIHDESYGYYDKDGNPTSKENDYLDYNDYYNNQLEEILSNPKYGNKGRFIEVWMDGAKGTGYDEQEYDFVRWFKTIRKYQGKEVGYESDCLLFGAEAYTTVRWIGNELGFAHKDTWSKSIVNFDENTIDSNEDGEYFKGFENGNKWTVPECDARITSGWFWGNEKKEPKSIKELAEMYFRSVGHNSTLLLNIPPNDKGDLDKDIKNRLLEFGENIRKTFENNILEESKISATNIRNSSKQFSPSNLFGNKGFWITDKDVNEASLLIELEEAKTFDSIVLEENIEIGQRINSYEVSYENDGKWELIEKGITIGAKRILRFREVTTDKIKIRLRAGEKKSISLIAVGAYKLTKEFEFLK